MHPPLSLLATALATALAACADDAAGPAPASGTVNAVNPRRSDDPRVAAARKALESGRRDLARRLVDQVGDSAGLESHLLRARLAALSEDAAGASRWIEEARLADPSDSRVYATSAELHAAAGRLETADGEIQRGLAVCGATPELERARGVYLICVQGGAEAGLAMLTAAVGNDPGIPFVARPLGQAHLLCGKLRMGAGDVAAAQAHAEQSLAFDEADVDARRFLADVLVAARDLEAAVAIYAALFADGEPVASELAHACKNAGFLALLEKRRSAALEHFMNARLHGLPDEELGTGLHALNEEARGRVAAARAAYAADDLDEAEVLAREALDFAPGDLAARAELASYAVHRGLAALKAGDGAAAETFLRGALEHDAESLEAHNFLGHALFEKGEFASAAEEWSWVVDTARLERLTLPEPVHLALAQASFKAGELADARETLEGYLLLEPAGEYVEETRKILAALPELPRDE